MKRSREYFSGTKLEVVIDNEIHLFEKCAELRNMCSNK